LEISVFSATVRVRNLYSLLQRNIEYMGYIGRLYSETRAKPESQVCT